MAKCRVEGLDDLVDNFKDLADNIDDIAKETLFEGGNILKDNMKAAITAATDRGYATGNLAGSIVPTVPEKNAMGYFVAVRPVGSDSKGVSNGAKLQFLEYGTSKQQERKELTDVTRQAEAKCAEIAQEVFNKHVKI